MGPMDIEICLSNYRRHIVFTFDSFTMVYDVSCVYFVCLRWGSLASYLTGREVDRGFDIDRGSGSYNISAIHQVYEEQRKGIGCKRNVCLTQYMILSIFHCKHNSFVIAHTK